MERKRIVEVSSRHQLRQLVRRVIAEYVADTDGDPHKDAHADPTGAAWDSGLDETDVGVSRDHELMMDFMRKYLMGSVDVDELDDATNPNLKLGFKLARKNRFLDLDYNRDVYVITQKGMDALEADPGNDEDVADVIQRAVHRR